MSELRQAFDRFHEEHPGVPLREAARELEVSEAELLHAFIGDGATPLKMDWPTLTAHLSKASDLLLETRSENAVLKSSHAVFTAPDFSSPQSRLRVAPEEIAVLFAVEEETHEGEFESLQAFTKDGFALAKIYFMAKEKTLAKIREALAAVERKAFVVSSGETSPRPSDAEAFYKKTKGQHVSPNILRWFFSQCTEKKIELSYVLERGGTRHEILGIIQKFYPRGPWMVVEASGDGEIRLRMRSLGSAFIVEKSAIHFFDKTGETMGAFSSKDALSPALLGAIPHLA